MFDYFIITLLVIAFIGFGFLAGISAELRRGSAGS